MVGGLHLKTACASAFRLMYVLVYIQAPENSGKSYLGVVHFRRRKAMKLAHSLIAHGPPASSLILT